MKTYWPIRSRKTSSRDCTSSGVKARKSATTSNVRLPIAAPTESGSARSPISCWQPSGSGRVVDLPRLRTKTSMPTSRHRWVHAELMIPEPPRYNTDKAGIAAPFAPSLERQPRGHVGRWSSLVSAGPSPGLAEAGHGGVPPGIHDAIRHQVHGRDDHLGRKRDGVARFWLGRGDRLENRLGDDLGLAASPLGMRVKRPHRVHLLAVGAVARVLLGALQGTFSPLGTDGARLHHDHVDAEWVQLQPQAVAEAFNRELACVVPRSEWLAEMPADGGDVDDLARACGSHLRCDQLSEPGQTEEVHLQLIAAFG